MRIYKVNEREREKSGKCAKTLPFNGSMVMMVVAVLGVETVMLSLKALHAMNDWC